MAREGVYDRSLPVGIDQADPQKGRRAGILKSDLGFRRSDLLAAEDLHGEI
jgi:hypothetical protein